MCDTFSTYFDTSKFLTGVICAHIRAHITTGIERVVTHFAHLDTFWTCFEIFDIFDACTRQGTERSQTHCNTLQHTATHCNIPQHTVTHCNTLQHTVTHVLTPIRGKKGRDPTGALNCFFEKCPGGACCSVLQCVAVCCSVLHWCFNLLF